MAVHGVVEQLARIGLLVAHHQALSLEHGDRDPRGAVVLVVEHADLPRARLVGMRGKARREAVQRKNQRGRCAVQQLGQRGVIGVEEPLQPGKVRGVVDHIAGNGVAIAGDRDHGGGMRLAVDVADEAAGLGLESGDPGALGHKRADFGYADVHRNVLGQQFGMDAKVNIGGHAVAGMVRHHQDPAETRCSEDAEGFVFTHRKAPDICHQPGCAAAIA